METFDKLFTLCSNLVLNSEYTVLTGSSIKTHFANYLVAGMRICGSQIADNYKLLSAVEYININYYKKITPHYLSQISGYSPAHLRRLFIKNFGVPPMEYILNKRVNVTKEMLLDAPEKTIDEVADLVGFCSASYLCKIFKKQTGISPAEYKKRNDYV